MEQGMRESHRKGVANRSDLESCAGRRKVTGEALTGAQAGRGSLTAQGSWIARVYRYPRCGLLLHRTASAPRTKLISQLDTLPACAPVNASPVTLRRPAHDSRSERFATPFLWDSLIPCSMPVYPGALGVRPWP